MMRIAATNARYCEWRVAHPFRHSRQNNKTLRASTLNRGDFWRRALSFADIVEESAVAGGKNWCEGETGDPQKADIGRDWSEGKHKEATIHT